MSRLRTPALVLLALWLVGCAGSGIAPPATPREAGPPNDTPGRVLLVSIDGFRWDFFERTETPHLDRVAREGARAERMIPSFPSKTFPNHYTLVTGLYPGHHGLVANNMWDPEHEALFGLGRREEVAKGRWYGGVPIWVIAERRGLRTSPYFWPGTEAEILGVRPTWIDPYDGDVPNRKRIDVVLDRMALEPSKRADFATLYFSLLDEAAHTFDPDHAPEVTTAIREVDDLVGYLLAGLERRGLDGAVDLILVSDHGMAANTLERAIRLDDLVDIPTANVVDWNPVAALWPAAADVDAVYEALRDAHPHLSVYRREEIPERYHYRDHRRVPPILAVADEGWVITTRRMLETEPGRYPSGSHGYDPELVSMGALFVARGPSFVPGLVSEPFENIHVYELICHLLGVPPAPNDGDLDAVRHLLREPGPGR